MLAHDETMSLGVDPPERTGELRLADGRQLAWSEWGPQGAPVLLLCPGAATSRRLGFATHALARLGVTLVSADRPGLGASDPQPNRTLLDWAADVRQLRNQRELELAGAVGFSQGAPFALALARAGLVPAVALVSGTDELAAPSVLGQVPAEVAAMITLAAADPTTAEQSFAAVQDAATMHALVRRMSSPQDLAVYTRADFAAAFEHALTDGFRQGAVGYARDTVITMSPWPFAVEDVDVPVDLWYGAYDSSPVHSPDLGESLSRRLRNARRRVLPAAGAAVLWTHGEAICRDLLVQSTTKRA